MIPEAAVEAAAREHARVGEVEDLDWALFADYARAILEAAAPHMLREAWEAAYAQGIEDERMSATSGTDYGPNRNNPYRTTK